MSAQLALLVVLAVALAIVYVYRRMVANSVDEFVHVSDSTTAAKQEATAKQLDKLDRVVRIVGLAFVLYAIGFGVWFSIQTFNNSGKLT